MKKTKWFVGLLLGAASLTGSQVANAAALEYTNYTNTAGWLVKLLSSDAKVTFFASTLAGATFDTDKSANVNYNELTLGSYDGYSITAGQGSLTDGTYGWLKLVPTGGATLTFTPWTKTGEVDITPLPEPEVLALLGIGAAGLLLARRRQKNQPTLAI